MKEKENNSLSIGKLRLFFDEEVQRLIDSFAYCFNVKITIFSARMEEMITGLRNGESVFCSLMREKLHLNHLCCRQHKEMCRKCENQNKTITYDCFSGFTEAITPIMIEKELAGYGLVGQFRTGKELPSDIVQLWLKAGFKKEELINAYEKQTFFDKLTLENMLKLFNMMISYIVTREYMRVRKPGIVQKIIQYIDDHISEPVSLDKVASALKCSRSSISHALQNQLGMSFKKICIIKKIRRFESLIDLNPGISIKEAASMVGYDDPMYFSRIYKKIRSTSPVNYVNTIKLKADTR